MSLYFNCRSTYWTKRALRRLVHLKLRVSQNTALHVSRTVRLVHLKLGVGQNIALRVSRTARLVHLKLGVGQDIALHVSRTVRNSAFSSLYTSQVHSTSFSSLFSADRSQNIGCDEQSAKLSL